MKKLTVFFSWQSDKPENKRILRRNIDKAIRVLSRDKQFASYSIERDEATRNESGSPNIVDTLHQKINHCAVFIADISPILFTDDGQGYPNPNVLLEEGFALRCIGHERIILVSDSNPEVLPFDISQRRTTLLGSDLLAPIRMALVAALDCASNEYEHSVIGHDTIVYQRFAKIIYSEEYFVDILQTIPVNLRISRYDNMILDDVVSWHLSGDGKYLNKELSESADKLSHAIECLNELIQDSIVDDLDQSNLSVNPTEKELEESKRHRYWYFKRVSGTSSYEEDKVVWNTQEKFYKATEAVINAYIDYRDIIRKTLFM